jgi:SAM-dependent methyltransferase
MFGIKTRIKHFIRDEIELALEELRASAPDPLAGIHDILDRQQNLAHTMQTKTPTAPDGSPLPWYTFPAIEYLQALDARGLDIFEYGCGSSSLFWARKGAHVWCVEHNPEWYETVRLQSSVLQGLMLREQKEGYAKAVHDPAKSFDIIVIDGAWRNECAVEALKCLKPAGLIILDNSDWYTDVAQMFQSKGFFQVDFSGFGPCNDYCWTTSLMLPLQSSFMQRWAQPTPIGGISISKGDTW